MHASNELPRGAVPAGAARNARPPAERPAVWARLVVQGGEVLAPGRALAWKDEAVWVEVDWPAGEHHEVWLHRRDVTRRDDGTVL